MKSDTADQHWSAQWKFIKTDRKWLTPEKVVQEWAASLTKGARILDLGADVGRHALRLTAQGFDVIALDTAPGGLAEINNTGGVKTVLARLDTLPFKYHAFDHVLSWNVTYNGDENILLRAIAEIRRVLKPGGSYIGTMLSKHRLPNEQTKYIGCEICRNSWVFDATRTDKIRPHYFCAATDFLALFSGFKCLKFEDREHKKPKSYYWHLIMERL